MKLKVLYEDNHLIAVFKPAGILTQPDFSREKSLMDYVKEYLKEKYKKPGQVFLGLLHRLDRPVSGVVLFAKTSKGASRLSWQFRNHQVEKIYKAVVLEKPKQKNGTLINYLKKNNNSKAQRAELFYEVMNSNNKYSLLKIKIKTGRFHQIRKQLALIGCPILELKDKSLALCATSISFYTATNKERKTISIPIPRHWESIY